jgi:hypothetical protein
MNPVFEWGQTVAVKVFGVDNPNASGSASSSSGSTTPKAIQLTFSLSWLNSGGNVDHTESYTITPDRFQLITDQTTLTDLDNIISDHGDYVAFYTLNLGNGDGSQQTPGAKVKITNIVETALVNGQTITYKATTDTGTVFKNSSGQLALTNTVDQATFGILNPIAVRGAGTPIESTSSLPNASILSLSKNSNVVGGDLGPFITFDNPNGGGWPAYQFAAGNGSNIPISEPVGGTITGLTGTTTFNPTKAQSTQTNAVAYTEVVLATGLGSIQDGYSGSNSTTYSNDPQNGSLGSISQSAIPQAFGSAFLNVADRSDVANLNNSNSPELTLLHRLKMDQTSMRWNDDSGNGGSGGVINALPWDSNPVAYTMGSSNPSPDYPDLAQGNLSATLIARSVGTPDLSRDLGATSSIMSTYGTLATTDTGTSNRTVYPHPLSISLIVPKFQPANLEQYPMSGANAGGSVLGNGVTHTGSNGTAQGSNMPHGYIGSVKLYYDSGKNGTYKTGDAYRVVQLWASVPADVNIAFQKPTIDVSAAPQGYGIENPITSLGAANLNSSISWSPFTSFANSSPYIPGYQSVSANSLSNINLINVHLDQEITYVNSSGSIDHISPLVLSSDSTSSLSSIPAYDAVLHLGRSHERGRKSRRNADRSELDRLLRYGCDLGQHKWSLDGWIR